MMEQQVKQVPYGVADFAKVIERQWSSSKNHDRP